MISLTLKVVGGDVETQEIPLRLPAVVGRGHDVAVNLTHPLVSRRHCELRESNGTVVVRDLASLNGTYIGSERVEEGVLRDGDLLTIGTVTFRAVYDGSSQAIPGQQPVLDGNQPQHIVRAQGATGDLNDQSKVETVRYHGAQPSPSPHRTAAPSGVEPHDPKVYGVDQGLTGDDASAIDAISSDPA